MEPLTAPTETLRQYTERRVRDVAARNQITQAEVRHLYGRDRWYSEWHAAIYAAAEAGQVLPARALDALDRIHRYRVLHDWPMAAPRGYVMKEVREAG